MKVFENLIIRSLITSGHIKLKKIVTFRHTIVAKASDMENILTRFNSFYPNI